MVNETLNGDIRSRHIGEKLLLVGTADISFVFI